jgi:beta-lactamase regulating signal transducer with metallopeptidase domain
VKVAYKLPETPPFSLISFASVHVVAGVLEFASDLLTADTNVGAVFLNIVRITLAMLYIWLAGTLPLQPILPGRSVAGSKDVRALLWIAPLLTGEI